MRLIPGTAAYRLRLALAPVCLCLVALLHLDRVQRYEQTPWKGGGFGMFSTVDTRGARFLRLFLVRQGGENRIPIETPEPLQKLARELQAAPDAARFERFAQRLATFQWLDRRQRQRRLSLGTQEISSNPLEPLGRAPQPSELLALPSGGQVPENESVLSGYDAVSIELWRYVFDAGRCQLVASRKYSSQVSLLSEDGS